MDRNVSIDILPKLLLVALRKESVDRNIPAGRYALLVNVALRKESVDRNLTLVTSFLVLCRRSPQGERG